MGLFEKEKVKEENIVRINPIIIRTPNVAKELLQTSLNYKVPVHTLDFHLLETQTFSKNIVEGANDDWAELSADELKELKESELLNPKFELKQIHEIEIFTITDSTPLDFLDMSIGGNSTLCKIYLTIKAGSHVQYYDRFVEDFILTVNKKKLRANLLIGLFDSVFTTSMSDLFAKVRVQENYHFEEQERFLIAQGYEPVETVNDQLILHYETKQQKMDDHGRIDYSKRGYLISAVKDELLIEYIKPKRGEEGRNCRGIFIAPKEPLVRHEPTFGTGEHISIVDTPNSIEYRAGAGGYVTFEGGIYDIRTEVDVTEISFKTTGSIETQLDADVSINVTEKDVLKDAIGMGMDVTVNYINIEGNIGPNAKVTAKKAIVEGQVHQSATISADELTINILKGSAFGKDVHITRLEHGIVEADKVTVAQATGGKIRAREIEIEILGSHVKMTASHRIEIRKLQGGENQFVIDPLLNETNDALDERAEQMVKVKESIREIKKELNGYEQTFRENSVGMEELKQKLLHYKKNSIKLPVAFVQKYQQYQQFKEKLASLRQELQNKEDQYNWLNERHIALQNEIFEARIINHDRWRNHNEIIFKLIDPPMEIFHIPSHNSDEKTLGLYEDDDGKFSIKVMTK